MERQLEYVLRTVEERGVRFVRLWFTDVLGFLKSVEITPAELEVALNEGMTFDGSAIEGYSRIQESDMLARPDANTFELLPNNDPDEPAVARMFCDIEMFSGDPFDGDPRYVLKRNLERAREKGFTFFVGPEMEFFYFRTGKKIEPLDDAGYFQLTAHDLGSKLRKQTVLQLEAMGIPVEYSFHENGPSQHEIDLRHTDALTMADNVMTFRLISKEVAADSGVYATFMPKPITGAFGSGMHTHLSLFEGDVNAFHDAGDEYGLSKVAKHFIAGLLVHASEICAITNQWVNSYKRLIPGYEAPVYKCWARNNRSALVRVPLSKRGKDESVRIEFRAPDAACNPYLSFAVMLAAGLKGIDEGYELPPEATDNIYALTDAERLAEGITSLPGSLRDALNAMEGSELVAEALGEHVFENFLTNKRREWMDYKTDATPFEIARSLPDLLIGTGGMLNDTLLVFPDPPPPLLAQTLDLSGVVWKAVANAAIAMQHEPTDGWIGAIVCADDDPEGAFALCRTLRKGDSRVESILLLMTGAQLNDLEHREELFDDFCLTPFHPKELEARVRHLMFRAGRTAGSPAVTSYGDLVLNFETYQAAVSGKPLDLTYMEYELLKFFVSHPGKVFTREQLLSRVWGYEYYGGARTVDVHVRRLRAKLGEEHANLIQTVRSVGYRFGASRWPVGKSEPASLNRP